MWDTLCAPNVSLIQKFHPIAWCVHTQQLNQRLDAIRGHCDSMGYGSEINPPHMNTRDQASRITESANNSLEASGRSLTHTCACAHCTMHLMNQRHTLMCIIMALRSFRWLGILKRTVCLCVCFVWAKIRAFQVISHCMMFK